MKKIIDTHAYIGRQPLVGMNITVDKYLALREFLKQQGFDVRFLLMSGSLESNKELSEIVWNDGEAIAGGILQINPNRNLEAFLGYMPVKDIEALIKKGGIVGLKNNTAFTKLRVDHKDMLPFADLAIGYGLPMVFHCSSSGQDFVSPSYVRKLLDGRPELKVVLAHFGGLNESYLPESKRLAKEHQDVYLNTAGLSGEIKRYDLSSFPPKEPFREHRPEKWEKLFLEAAEDLRGKIVFGSDHPELSFTLHPVDRLKQEIQEEILYSTPKNVFRLHDC